MGLPTGGDMIQSCMYTVERVSDTA